MLVDDHSKAELLNSFFSSVGLSDNGSQPSFNKRTSDNKDEITDLRFTPEQVFKQLKKLKVNTAAGSDRLPPLFLKKLASAFFPLQKNLICHLLPESYLLGFYMEACHSYSGV